MNTNRPQIIYSDSGCMMFIRRKRKELELDLARVSNIWNCCRWPRHFNTVQKYCAGPLPPTCNRLQRHSWTWILSKRAHPSSGLPGIWGEESQTATSAEWTSSTHTLWLEILVFDTDCPTVTSGASNLLKIALQIDFLTPCSDVVGFQRFGSHCCLHVQGSLR
jgi:hypothetical protein